MKDIAAAGELGLRPRREGLVHVEFTVGALVKIRRHLLGSSKVRRLVAVCVRVVVVVVVVHVVVHRHTDVLQGQQQRVGIGIMLALFLLVSRNVRRRT